MVKRLILLTACSLFIFSLSPSLTARAGLFDKLENKKDSNALPAYDGPKKRLAVMPLEDKAAATATTTVVQGVPGQTPASGPGPSSTISIAPPSDFGTGLTEMLTTSLSQTHRYVLLERQNLADVTGEQKQDTDPSFNQNSAPKGGALLGAQLLIRGAITEYSYNQSGTSSGTSIGNGGNPISNILGSLPISVPGASTPSVPSSGLGIGYSSCTAKITLDLRIVDASTGEILDSVDADGSSTSKAFNLTADIQNAQVGTSNFNNSPLGKAVREAIDKAVYEICTDQTANAIPWEAQIADTDASGQTVSALYIDEGSEAGIKVGDVLTVLKPGRTILSPETQTVIGRTKDTIIGHCHIDSVTTSLATASVVDGAGFAVGQCVRYPADVPTN